MQDYFNARVDAVSFHRPIDLELFQRLELNSLPHAYETLFLENFKYFSDSRGLWRFGNPLESKEFKNNKNLHLLIHPIWWNEEELEPIDTIKLFKKITTITLINIYFLN
ncbi:MAG: hypothetical protein HC905_25935 [Bacteroidales bacterium]|nr:hypothetical protein [Bacteroidales bacterium]